MSIERGYKSGALLYHVTPVQFLPSIMKEGLLPKLGTIAFGQGEDQPAIHAYVTAQAVRDAVAYGGEYRRLAQAVYGVGVRLCILQILSRPVVGVTAEDGKLPAARLVLPVPAHCVIVLDTNLHPICPDVLSQIQACPVT